jgi:hypothetical protein
VDREMRQDFLSRVAIGAIIVAVVGGVVAIHHENNSAHARSSRNASPVDPSRLIYIKDERTDLCYAVRNSDLEGGLSFTHVPCSHRVEALIVQDAR